MSIQEIDARLQAETRLYEIAKAVRTLLDEAGKLKLPDGRDGEQEALELATE